MTYILISVALFMALTCLGNGMKKETTKFGLTASILFSVAFFVLVTLILIGGMI